MLYIYEKNNFLYGTTKEIKDDSFKLVETAEYVDDLTNDDVPFRTGAFDNETSAYGCKQGATIKVTNGKVYYKNRDGGWQETPALWNEKTGEYLHDGVIKSFFI